MFAKTIWIFVLILSLVKAARILAFFPTPSISHQIVYRNLVHELARRGHEVTVVTPDPTYPAGKAPANLTEIDVHDVSYNDWKEIFVNHQGNKNILIEQVKHIFEKFASVVDLQLQNKEVQKILKKDTKYFDLLILEACNRPILGISSIFDAPVIHINSFGVAPFQYSDFGAPMHPLLYPTPGRQRLYHLSLLDKGIEILKHIAFDYLIAATEEHDHLMIRKHFPNAPSFHELRKNIQMLFINEHPIWADNHPVAPNIVYIGGIHQPKIVELPQDLKDFLDSSKNGVIYISFGTNVDTKFLPEKKIKLMIKVLSELPYDVLWKWDGEKLPVQPKNIKISNWFPQPSLLRHPKIKLFITQGGMQSTDETIDAGVPVIGIPMFGDQWYNVEKYVYHKIGLQLDIQTITEEEFKSSINTVIDDSSFKSNTVRLRNLMRAHPVRPLDRAVWWTEHVIQYGGKHLQPPAAFMHWTDYYELKLILVALSILGSLLLLAWFAVKITLKYVQTWMIKVKLKVH